ncbi:hypothetical protein MEPL4_4c00130 [Melissococcus plutonius]|nr:hypothetical protein MEPL_c009930 [Melissococcus plutonius S1]KMT23424.1 hypothetical protein MEPL2_43p00060 [Melissococcus plutonius]KMT25182.1 hypothetical protein MEPL2_2c07400 [Melissococcus plutonius]KMT26088.1 hypothetical protein MEPL3_3c00130 [Melissococcus plutonius]KMT26818.1 hypothetical protein MEPL1_4c00130 [Melissococcus plutonius]
MTPKENEQRQELNVDAVIDAVERMPEEQQQ